MPLMLSSLYDALIAAKVPEDQARKAAEEVAHYDNRIVQVEGRLSRLEWMVGTNIALTVGVLVRLFTAP